MKPYTKIAKWIMALGILGGVSQAVFSEEIRIDVSLDSSELVVLRDPDSPNGKFQIAWGTMRNEITEGKYDLPLYSTTVAVPLNASNISVKVENYTLDHCVYAIDKIHFIEPCVTSASIFDTSESNEGCSQIHYQQIPTAQITTNYITQGYNRYIGITVSPFLITENDLKPCKDFVITVNYDLEEGIGGSYPLDYNAVELLQSKSQKNLPGSSQSPDYIIITTSELFPHCESLRMWKAQKGLHVEMITVEEILGTSFSRTPLDEAEAIRWYLQSKYNPAIDQYCLLVGPTEQIPARYLYKSTSREGDDGDILHDNFIPTDIYYTDLLSDYNLNFDSTGIFTTQLSSLSFSPCMYVGRLICNTPAECHNYIKKLMIYEAFPGKGKMDYLSKGVVTKQSQHLNYNDFVTEMGTLNEVTVLKDEQIRSFVYGKPTGNQVISAMSQAGLISLQGHGGPTSLACAGLNGDSWHWRYIKPLESYDYLDCRFSDSIQNEVNAGLDMLNNPWTPSIVFSLSCDVMPFDRVYGYTQPYNMGTSYTVGGLYGGVAFLGNTRTGWDRYNKIIESNFANNILSNKSIGQAHSAAKVSLLGEFNDLLSKYSLASHNILGDPEISIWLNIPSENNLTMEFKGDNISVLPPPNTISKVTLTDGDRIVTDSVVGRHIFSPVDEFANPGMYVFSVWSNQTCPIIDFFGRYGKLSNQSKSFYVKRAFIGTDNQKKFEISENASLSVLALSEMTIGSGFTVGTKSFADLQSYNSINTSGATVKSNGTLKMKAETITLGQGFSVDSGGILEIESTQVYFTEW